MNRNVLIGSIVAVAIILLGTWAYIMSRPAANTNTPTSDGTNTTSEAPTTQEPATDTKEVASAATITYTDEGFSPSATTVKKGATITVTNNSSADLMFSSADHPTHQLQPELNMDTLKPGESGTITVTKVGTWGYHDHLKAGEQGTIIVTE
jgi:plastocyanin